MKYDMCNESFFQCTFKSEIIILAANLIQMQGPEFKPNNVRGAHR